MVAISGNRIMQVNANFSAVDQERIGRIAFDRLWEMFPECRMQNVSKPMLALSMPFNDSRLVEVTRILEAHGLKPRNASVGKRMPDEYDFALERIYDSSDWEAAELLVPVPWEGVVDHNIDEQGRICIDTLSINEGAIGEEISGDAYRPRIFVSSR